MRKLTIYCLFVSFCLILTNVSYSQVNTPPLTSEEAEVIKPLEKFIEFLEISQFVID